MPPVYILIWPTMVRVLPQHGLLYVTYSEVHEMQHARVCGNTLPCAVMHCTGKMLHANYLVCLCALKTHLKSTGYLNAMQVNR